MDFRINCCTSEKKAIGFCFLLNKGCLESVHGFRQKAHFTTVTPPTHEHSVSS